MRLQTKYQFYDSRQAALDAALLGVVSYGVTMGGGWLCLDCLRRHGKVITGHTFDGDYPDDPQWTVLEIVKHWVGKTRKCSHCGTGIEPTYKG